MTVLLLVLVGKLMLASNFHLLRTEWREYRMDEKQWLVSRLDAAHEIIFGELKLSKDDFIRIREEIIEDFRSKRNMILSVVIFTLVLFTGLYETHWINESVFLGIFIPDLILGLGVFLILDEFINFNSNAFIHVENSIIQAQQNLNHNYGFLIEKTLDLNQITMSVLHDYTNCMAVLSGIIIIPFGNALKESSKYKFLVPYYRRNFIDSAKSFEKTIDVSISLFANLKKENIPLPILEYVQKTMSQYKKD